MTPGDGAAAALFIPRDDGTFQPTELTRGGWSDDAQHGSPPSGLLARAIERVTSAFPMQMVRYTIDLYRPVPLDPLTVTTRTLRDGRRIQVVEALLFAGELEVGRASGLKIRVTELDLPVLPDHQQWEQPPGPGGVPVMDWEELFGRPPRTVRFHVHGVEIRTIDGSFHTLGPGTSWFRLRQPLVAGEVPTPFQRLATLADMSNGNSQSIDSRHWTYVNPDITLYLHRLPAGEWVGMRSVAHQHPSGIGLAESRVFDEDGLIGTINQAQLLDRQRRG